MKRIIIIVAFFIVSACTPTLPATTSSPEQPQSKPATPTPGIAPTEVSPSPQTPTSAIWQPAVGATWQIQYTGESINTDFDADIYDLDLFDTEASLISELHSRGIKVVCYISVGSWEDWRPDAGDFPSTVIGNDYEGWAGENWLDIRQVDLLAPIMRTRLDLCAAKGFDGVAPDNMDAYWTETGFPLTYEDQLAYNLWLAEEAHARGLAIGLKNNEEQVADSLDHFEWALTESCFDGEWCQQVQPFIAANKPVFAIEYADEMSYERFISEICPAAAENNYSVLLKNRNLDAYMAACP